LGVAKSPDKADAKRQRQDDDYDSLYHAQTLLHWSLKDTTRRLGAITTKNIGQDASPESFFSCFTLAGTSMSFRAQREIFSTHLRSYDQKLP
jgi:hypothetical protein